MTEFNFPEKFPCFFDPKNQVCTNLCPLHNDMVTNIRFVAEIRKTTTGDIVNSLYTASDEDLAKMISTAKIRHRKVFSLFTPESTKVN